MNGLKRLGTAIAAGVMAFTGYTAANASVTPDVGVSEHNVSMCGDNMWTYINVSPRVKAHDSAGTCITAEKYHADFAVTRVTQNIGWQYPNLSDGWELGETGCPSTADMNAGLCSRLPVKWKNDGTPYAQSDDWDAPGVYNDSYDIWFSHAASDTSYTRNDGDVELMIWVDHPGIHDSFSRYVTIAGTRYGVMSWEAYNKNTKQFWRYIAYVAPTARTGSVNTSLWLNEFFRDANAHGDLPSSYWLIAVDKGFELCSRGTGDNVHYFRLSGLK